MAAAAAPLFIPGVGEAIIVGGIVVTGGYAVYRGIVYLLEKGTNANALAQGGAIAKAEEEKNDIRECCCGNATTGFHYNMLPNGHWKQHFVMCKSRKDAEEKATNYPGSQGALYHTCTKDKKGNIIDPRPHFHPCKRLPNGQLDEKNGKIPSVHFCFNE